jgi:hypothetical protein
MILVNLGFLLFLESLSGLNFSLKYYWDFFFGEVICLISGLLRLFSSLSFFIGVYKVLFIFHKIIFIFLLYIRIILL